jgi:hypothetical protein
MLQSRIALLALVAALLPLQAALAETPGDAATRWGLIGTWRFKCGTPPSRDDVVLTFAVRSNRLYHDRNWGDGKDSSLISSAAVLPNGMLDLTLEFTSLSQKRENVLRLTPDGKMITVTSRNAITDEYLIKNGKVVADDAPIAALTRCSVP